ncbi:benzoate 4-monooxygenase cytochrome P450, partial [Fusarium pseudoanthophilum]
MPPKMPRFDDLLVLLEVFFAPERGVLPGGTATKAELDFAEKDSPIKGEDVKPGPWPGGSSPNSVKDDGSAAVAGAS